MSSYTQINLNDVENQAPNFGMPEEMEARFASGDLGLEQSGAGTAAARARLPHPVRARALRAGGAVRGDARRRAAEARRRRARAEGVRRRPGGRRRDAQLRGRRRRASRSWRSARPSWRTSRPRPTCSRAGGRTSRHRRPARAALRHRPRAARSRPARSARARSSRRTSTCSARREPALGAIVRDRFDEALAEADAADARWPPAATCRASTACRARSRSRSRWRAMPLTAGVVARRGEVATETAPTAARLLATGAIPLGTTNTSELTMWIESENRVYGRTNNAVRPDAHGRRVLRRRGRGRRQRRLADRPRLGHRRLDPAARVLQRRVRPQALVVAGAQQRPVAARGGRLRAMLAVRPDRAAAPRT